MDTELASEIPFSPLQMTVKRRDKEDADNELSMQQMQCKEALQSVEEQKAHLQKTVERMVKCKEDFHDYLKIKDTDRQMALRKVKLDRQFITLRQEHIHAIEEEITDLIQEKEELEMAVQKLAFYSHHMDTVVQASKMEARQMICRFQTLMAARDSMRLTTEQGQKSINVTRHSLANLNQENSNAVMQLNSSIAQHQRQLDEAQQNSMQWDVTWTRIQKTAADQVILFGKIRMACLNLYRNVSEKSLHCQQCPVDPENTIGQLGMIETFITQWISALKMSKNDPRL